MTSETPATPRASNSATRPFYWSVQRELWENRSIYVAPMVAAVVVLFGNLLRILILPHRMREVLVLDLAKQRAAVIMPFVFVPAMLILTAFIVGVFYSLDALQSERRDRSILFWKSLPVSDRTTVFAKAAIPLVVLPLLVLALVVMAQMTMLFLSTVMLMGNGPGVATLWSNLHLFQMWIGLLYALIAIALWHAPIYGWLLLVSGWAKRATFLWAVLPVFAIGIFEKIAFNTSYFGLFLKYRFMGFATEAFDFGPGNRFPSNPLSELTPGNFLITPGLWIGLIFAAAFLAGAVRLRRDREPI